MAVEHLVGLGYRHFAYVGLQAVDGSRDRRKALAHELARHDLPLQAYDTERFYTGTYADFTSLDEVEPGLVELIRAAEKPLAVVAINDLSAVTVCRIAEAAGLAVPVDVAVVGVGRRDRPGLSAARQQHSTGDGAYRVRGLAIGPPVDPRRGPGSARCRFRPRNCWNSNRRSASSGRPPPTSSGPRSSSASGPARGSRRARGGARACAAADLRDQFAAATGRTVGAEIRRVRLEQVKTLLETTDLPPGQRGPTGGHERRIVSQRVFRRWEGMTPIQYRRQRRG